ncbi:hypothetical protein SMC26_09180 [Actinomadura fulvescens]|uniref:Beta-ketoacyl synthase-like N-terminal domain-containing protein n=1 Tax=Actinomadura fulvescens TaxID=46160 RepID=A0ABP6CKM6_9ACTN
MITWDDAKEMQVLGDGLAETADLASASRARTSFYADPVAWLVVDALERALEQADKRAQAACAETGVLAVSAYGTRHTMGTIARQVPRGRVSPLRFAGASPGSLAGLACIVLGFRGPSLLLCMPPETARPVALSIASNWMTTGLCEYVAVAEHTVTKNVHTATEDVGGAVHAVRGWIVQWRGGRASGAGGF